MRDLSKLRWLVLAGLLLLGMTSAVLAVATSSDVHWQELALNLGTELVGAVLIYVLLDLAIERQERRRQAEAEEAAEQSAYKADLIARMGSRVNEVAVAATECVNDCETTCCGI